MKKMLKYQIMDLSKAFIVYFGVLFAIIGSGSILSLTFSSPAMNINFNGTGFSNVFLTFMIGLCMYKEHYLMALQNGISRRTFFKSSMYTIAVFSFACSLADTILLIAAKFLSARFSSFQILNVMELLYAEFFDGKKGYVMILTNLLFTFIFSVMSAALGILIASVFCRIPKKHRTMYVIALPIFCFLILPLSYFYIPGFWNGAGRLFVTLMGLNAGSVNPLTASLSMLAGSIILAGLCYLFLRKTEV